MNKAKYWLKPVEEIRKLETMSPDEFCKMFVDVGKGHHIEGHKIEAAQMHLPDKKVTYGFGFKKHSNCFSHVWEFKHLVKIVYICDWLDYHGFDRPRWRPS